MRVGCSMFARSPGLRLVSRVITFSPSFVSSNSLLCLLGHKVRVNIMDRVRGSDSDLALLALCPHSPTAQSRCYQEMSSSH